MSDVIKFRCKSCEKKIAVRPDYAGKKVKCPGCKQPLRVPSPRPARSSTGVPVLPGDSSSDSSAAGASSISLTALAAMEENAPVELRELSSKATRQSQAPRIEGGKDCPSCDASVKPDAVLCVHCGHNFESGKKLKTKKDSKVGKAFASVKGAAISEPDNAGSGWSFWSIGVGGVLSAVGVAMTFYNFRPESDPDADEAHIIEIGLLFMYDTMGPMVSGGITLVIGLCMLAYGFKVYR